MYAIRSYYGCLVLLQTPVANGADLVDDFCSAEVAAKAHVARAAEGTAHGATDLGRDAEGVAVLLGNHHRLNDLPVLSYNFV